MKAHTTSSGIVLYERDRPTENATPEIASTHRDFIVWLREESPDALRTMGYEQVFAYCRICKARFEAVCSVMYKDGEEWKPNDPCEYLTLPCPHCEHDTVMVCQEGFPENFTIDEPEPPAEKEG